MEELEKRVEEQVREIDRLKRELSNFDRMSTIIKCRDCTFRTNDVLRMQEHSEATGHCNFCFIRGGQILTDWIKLDVKRKEPER